jgi:hypothetical protein
MAHRSVHGKPKAMIQYDIERNEEIINICHIKAMYLQRRYQEL